MSALETHLYQCTSRHCFKDSFNAFAHFHDERFTHHIECSAVLDQNSMTPMPHPPYSPHASPSLFSQSSFFVCLFPWMKKVLKGKRFVRVEEVKLTNGRSAKRHQSRLVQICFEQGGKNVSVSVLHQMGSTLKVTGV